MVPQSLPCAFPKTVNIIFYNPSTVIKIRKFNVATVLLSNPQTVFTFHQLSQQPLGESVFPLPRSPAH
jgi:hypothetical protein